MADDVTNQKRKVFLSWEDDIGQSIEFDATMTEGHVGNSEVTDHPVESGVDFTDHIRRMPSEVTLTAIVTDDPLVVNRSTDAEAANTGGDPNRRARSAYDWLVETKDSNRLLRIFTTLRNYRNMVITSLSVTRDAEGSNIIRADIALREILIAVTEQVEAPEPRAPTRRRKRKQGKKTKTKESEANKAKARDTSKLIGLAEKAGIGNIGNF